MFLMNFDTYCFRLPTCVWRVDFSLVVLLKGLSSGSFVFFDKAMLLPTWEDGMIEFNYRKPTAVSSIFGQNQQNSC